MDQLSTNGKISLAPAIARATDGESLYDDKIRKLAQLTRQGTIEWKTVNASAIPTLSFARVLTAYEAKFGNERLRLIETGYEKQSQFGRLIGVFSMFPQKTNEMDSIVLSLHLLDINGRPTFKFPEVEAIYELASEIKQQQSDVTGLFDAIDAAVDTTEKQPT